jgi:hypothetical protein
MPFGAYDHTSRAPKTKFGILLFLLHEPTIPRKKKPILATQAFRASQVIETVKNTLKWIDGVV